MAVNFAYEYAKFKKEQEELRKKYEEAGMSQEQIREMYDFDYAQLNKDLAFKRHTIPLYDDDTDGFEREAQNPMLRDYRDRFSVTQQPDETRHFWWMDEIEDEDLLNFLMKLSDEELNMIDLLAFQELTQKEVAIEIHVSQSAVAQRIKTIRKKLKR